ncbi:xanthine dehydrogenase family protein molybdopterin-binding subunit [Mesorhizobium sp. B4-1-3]|uniref:xanthine dehydrogenase family protein molybdopterin-binding subunit n=1 Tax=Mesorhizobium sp. B4-1-3 TaxID=2589889 RepID=UPI00112860BA|nr:xanthine dehydrogenase family protein molybdopterin-binding subunit [Mesorhizobium sp. B4-1-3]TPI08511.1 xanthine dehydrogenase family protein molybdopterin-binding subunit [Mesorhizobium sp. B4-1-3]
MPSDAATAPHAAVGRATVRVDGPLKVSGAARYTSDFHFPGMLYAVPVGATIASGTIAAIDTRAAEAMPGVRKVYTRHNIGKFYRVPTSSKALINERRPPLDDDAVHYYGQYIALVVADTFEHATAAARKVKASYSAVTNPNVSTSLAPAMGDASGKLPANEPRQPDSERGDPDAAFASASVQVDHTYNTPFETHSSIELHASVATFDGVRFTLYETTQAVMNSRQLIAQMLGVPTEDVRIVTEFLGTGFGGKGSVWPHSLLAAAAARDLRQPVKLVLTREETFECVGHRPHTQQRIRLGATSDGKLVSLRHDFIYSRARLTEYRENCGESSSFMYSTPNLRITSAFAGRDTGVATTMRGPGAVPGMYALESAMDELAVALKMDPVELRLKNEPAIDESKNIPFSSRHLKECLTTGAEKFGWSRRKPEIGSMRDGDVILGWGVAACTWMAARIPAQASVMFNADGSVRVASATQDIGTGTYTVLAQMVSQLTGVTVDRVKVVIGDTTLPPGPFSGGSMATASLVPAVAQAAREAIGRLLAAAAEGDSHFDKASVAQLDFHQGRVHRKGQQPNEGRSFEDVLAAARLGHVEGHGKSAGTRDEEHPAYSTHSFGAHFVEVAWQPEIARLRVNRAVTVIDAGRIINPLMGRNQIEGAVTMGIGMALFEETNYDARNGMPVNSNLADYIMATHADTPPMDVIFLDYPDTHLNEMGARGIGEIGLAGIAAAITNAVYHATGVRVRDLPVHIEDLLIAA